MMRLIAHRGASTLAPENTAAAFRKARDLGASAVEFDVQQTRDGALVVMHDTDFKRVSNLRKKLKDLTLSELKTIDIGSWFDAKFSAERVPTLGQVFGLVGGLQEIHLEIKEGEKLYPGITEKILAEVDASGLKDKIVLSSFHRATVFRARELDPSVRIGYLVHWVTMGKAFEECAALRAESVHLSARRVNKAWVDAAHQRGLEVLVYTVNGERRRERMRALGVDAVFSDGPA